MFYLWSAVEIFWHIFQFLLAFLKAILILKTFPPTMGEFLEIVFLDLFILPPSQMRRVGYLDGVGQSFKTLLLSLLSLYLE